MFHQTMTKMVQSYRSYIDKPLKDEILQLNKSFSRIPCFLHKAMEHRMMRSKQLSVVIEFEPNHYKDGYRQVCQVINGKRKCGVRKQFSLISCCSADVTPDALNQVFRSCNHIKKVYLNRTVHALLDKAVPSVNADNLQRNNNHLTGKGVTIAVVDTGIHPHEDLQGRIAGFVDFIENKTAPYDDNGHGTHCAGCAVGSGAASVGQYQGPAAKANIVGVKVLDRNGAGTLETMMQGLQWCMEYNNNHENKIDIINLSLGYPAQRYDEATDDPMVKMVEKAWENGIVVVAAAGNEGPEPQTIASPGISEKIITVGALDDQDTAVKEDDEAADFSSRGPTVYGETKPDVIAPGVNIISLRSPRSTLDKLQKTNRVGKNYFSMSGTSMACPLVAGVCALLLEADPSISPDRVKKLLMEGADTWSDENPNIYGAGYVNAENSLNLLK
ncbi:serine protease AprX [Alteribacillus persepolensis]|uniref:Serine protease AprX n=1 Tax=Alteribacillus persepolensis TaxID=568899 RepID=A0A1G8BN46_9BACI|nr:S8 family peptidase [Alteribacillus persepolensis]SDH34636.1 serine protease AprX [Alteribacillus persepolensis]